MAKRKRTGKPRPRPSKQSQASAKSTVSGPTRKTSFEASPDRATAKIAGTEELAEAFPYNQAKPTEFGEASAKPAVGQTAEPRDPMVGGSTLSEVNASVKAGQGNPQLGINPGNGALDRTRVDSSGRPLTTNQGVRIADNQTARLSEWDNDKLTTELMELQKLDYDLDLTGFSGDELLANLIVLLVAGFETTTNLLGNGLVALLDHPDAAAALRERPDLAPAYVDELLRYDSPVQLTSRMSTAPSRYGDVDLPPESWVIVLLGAANRDPRRYPDPARFDPWRAQIAPLSFGAGPHYCLGAALARLEAQVAFPLLLRRLPGLVVAGRPERQVRLTLRGHATLTVRVGREAAPVTVPGTPPGAAGPTP